MSACDKVIKMNINVNILDKKIAQRFAVFLIHFINEKNRTSYLECLRREVMGINRNPFSSCEFFIITKLQFKLFLYSYYKDDQVEIR